MLLKELRYYFTTPIAYISMGIYILAIGLFLWVIPGEYNIADSGYAQLDGLFQLSPWLLMLLAPALTMHSIAEEKTLGTWDILAVKPYPMWKIILWKLLAAWFVCLIALILLSLNLFLVSQMAEPKGNVDISAFIGSMLGLMLISLAFSAIGIWASSVASSQIVAFILGASLCFFFFYGFDLFAMLLHNGHAVDIIERVGMNYHYESLSRGVLDLSDIIYFLSVATLFSLLTLRKK